MTKFLMALAASAMTLTGCTAAQAQYGYRDGYHQRYDRFRGHHNRHRTQAWRGRDGRYYCRRSNGSTGLVVGALAGGLLGRTIDTRGDRTLGTVAGGVGGALLGREIDRGNCR